jgi:hypothetical protein
MTDASIGRRLTCDACMQLRVPVDRMSILIFGPYFFLTWAIIMPLTGTGNGAKTGVRLFSLPFYSLLASNGMREFGVALHETGASDLLAEAGMGWP